jgi:3-oxoacyl-[acyl-carrier-protein] synthase-1
MENREDSAIPLALTGMGMATPVGYDAPTACASIRAGVANLEVLEEFPYVEFFRYGGDIVKPAGGRVTGLTDGHLGASRFSRLAMPALAEAIEISGINLTDLNRVKFIIALPDVARPGRDERMEKVLIRRIAGSVGFTKDLPKVEYIYSGHASACVALQNAQNILAKGEADHIIVGGIESFLEPATLLWLKKEGRLKSDSNVNGFNPGEASFFLVVEKKDTAAKRKAKIIAYLKGIAVATEKDSILSKKPPTGIGLSQALGNTLKHHLQELPISMVICDMNGERYRGAEWGYALVRTLKGVKGTLKLWHPADCIGDTGIASAGISIILGATAINKGYADGKHVLIWASSDNGTRGSLIVAAAEN